MDIETLMTRLAEAGVTALIKVDDERMAEGGEAWTVVLSGAVMGEQGGIRAEAASLSDCVRIALQRLSDRPGDWSWTKDITG
ncbi:hypothetical protein [Amycolatopsis sp. NPDC058986]|uniref:hypothetical protein n=1 Tax=unclassified Amycolatopsis TaxID=2618356 RepID=UPI00366F31F5